MQFSSSARFPHLILSILSTGRLLGLATAFLTGLPVAFAHVLSRFHPRSDRYAHHCKPAEGDLVHLPACGVPQRCSGVHLDIRRPAEHQVGLQPTYRQLNCARQLHLQPVELSAIAGFDPCYL